MNNLYISHHFTPQNTAFEQATACLSVVFQSLPGSIPFTILWVLGEFREKHLHEHELQLSGYNI